MGYWAITAMDLTQDSPMIGCTGDAPADYMGLAVERMANMTYDELHEANDELKAKLFWQAINTPAIVEGLNAIYQEDWGRDARTCEVRATLEFVIGVSI